MLVNDFDGKLYKFAVANPEIVEESKEKVYLPDGEGCLSVPRETEGIVPRAKNIKVKAILYDTDKKTARKVTMKLDDYIAIVFQHEFDHLDGILFVDRLVDEAPNNAENVFANYFEDYEEENEA